MDKVSNLPPVQTHHLVNNCVISELHRLPGYLAEQSCVCVQEGDQDTPCGEPVLCDGGGQDTVDGQTLSHEVQDPVAHLWFQPQQLVSEGCKTQS